MSLTSDMKATLSLYTPKEEKEMKVWNAWQTIQRGGRRTYEHGNLKYINMLREGSVFNSSVDGRVSDISEGIGKGIYQRYGKAFCIPVTQI
jgi:CRISPR/Cas system CSM-associated protein Csm4 (group 5 of RAMP superfamily)